MLRRLLLALAALALAGAPAHAISPSQEILFFTGGGVTYTPPQLVNPYAITIGHSIIGNGGGVAVAGSAFSVNQAFGNGSPGWIFALSNGLILAEQSFNYGIGSSTTASLAGKLNTASAQCGDPSNYQTWCFNPVLGNITTALTSGGNNTASAGQIDVNSVTGVVAGDFPIVGVASYNYQDTVASTQTSGCTYASAQCGILQSGQTLGASVSNAQQVIFSHPGGTNNFYLYGGAGLGGCAGTTGSPCGPTINSTDPANNVGSTGVFSFVSDPAQLAYIHHGANDACVPSGVLCAAQTMKNIALVLDGLGPNSGGPNKMVVLFTERPTGLAEGYSVQTASVDGAPETTTIPAPSGPYTYTAVNAANYWDTQQVFYMPCPASSAGTGTSSLCGSTGAPPYSAGSNDGVNLTYCDANCVSGGGPAAGQYSVSSGVYTFNSADASKKIGIYYRYKGTLGGYNSSTPSMVNVTRDWALDNTHCNNNFTDYGTNYGVNGALCGRPWVTAANSFDLLKDLVYPNNCTSGNPCINAPYTIVDGLHPTPYGGNLYGKAAIAGTPSYAMSATPAFPLPTANNPQLVIAWFSNSSSAQTSTCGGGTGGTTQKFFATNLNPTASTLGSSIAVGDTILPNVTTDIPANTTITCIDTTNNVLQMSAASTGGTAAVTVIQHDPNSFIGNGVFGHTGANIVDTTTMASGCGNYITGATINNAGSGGTTGAVTLTVAGGTALGGSATLSGTVASGALTGSLTVSYPGNYRVNPTLTANAVTATGGLTGATVNLTISGTTPASGLCGTPSTGHTITAQALPYNWGSLGFLDSASATELAEGKMSFAYGIETNWFGDSYGDSLVFQVAGYAGNGGGSIKLTAPVMAESNLSINAGDMHRMACDIKISAGPNGHLYGLTSPGIATYETISSGFHPPIGGNATTYLTDVGVAGSGVINFSDANVSQFVVGATLAAGGTGGTTGNQVVTVSGGTATEAATLNVTISGGAITSVNDVAFHGLYTALPSNPVTVTGAGLSGATVNLTWDTPPANVTNGILDLPLVTPPSIAGQLGYSSASFSAASYNSTTGLLTLTFASNPFTPILGNNVGNYATISGITGTGGGVSSLAGSFQVVGVSGGTVVLQAPLALTASALSGGTLAAQTASTVSSEGPYIQVQWNPNEPVSFTIRYRACKAGKTTT